ncbi:hypothetical protein BgiBS90_031093, partial [Biomphalaria glabrata]
KPRTSVAMEIEINKEQKTSTGKPRTTVAMETEINKEQKTSTDVPYEQLYVLVKVLTAVLSPIVVIFLCSDTVCRHCKNENERRPR